MSGNRTSRQHQALRDIIRAVTAAGSTRDPADRVAALIPAAACAWYGCPGRPTWWLGRFAERPWRCERCCTWWRTENQRDFENYYRWRWVDISHEAPTEDQPEPDPWPEATR